MSKFFSHDFIHINELKKNNYTSQKYIVVFLEGFLKKLYIKYSGDMNKRYKICFWLIKISFCIVDISMIPHFKAVMLMLKNRTYFS